MFVDMITTFIFDLRTNSSRYESPAALFLPWTNFETSKQHATRYQWYCYVLLNLWTCILSAFLLFPLCGAPLIKRIELGRESMDSFREITFPSLVLGLKVRLDLKDLASAFKVMWVNTRYGISLISVTYTILVPAVIQVRSEKTPVFRVCVHVHRLVPDISHESKKSLTSKPDEILPSFSVNSRVWCTFAHFCPVAVRCVI